MNGVRVKLVHPVVDTGDDESETLPSADGALVAEVDGEYLPHGPSVIETAEDAERAAAGILDVARRAKDEGFDCCVVNCMDDPGVEAIRTQIGLPAFGAGGTTVHAATTVSDGFTIVAPDERSVPTLRKMVSDAGIQESRANICTLDLSVADLRTEEAVTVRRFERAVVDAVAEGHGTVVPGCTDLSPYLGRLTLPERVVDSGVTILDPIRTAVRMAATLTGVEGPVRRTGRQPRPDR